MKKIVIVMNIIFFMLTYFLAGAQSDYIGTSVTKLMELEVDSRVNSLGGAYCGYVSDIIGYQANIAGIAELEDKQVAMTYYDWLVDTTILYGAFGMPLSKKFVGVASFKYLYVPDFINKNEWGEDSGNIGISDYVFSAGAAYRYLHNLKFGINVKYNRQSYALGSEDLLSFSSFGIDLGTQYRIDSIKLNGIPLITKKVLYLRGLQLGLAVQNIGLSSSADSVAPNIKLGVAYPIIKSLAFLFDINKEMYQFSSIIDSDYRFNFGLEFNYKSIVYIRGGVKLGYDSSVFTVGAGVQTHFGSLLSALDYGYDGHKELGHLNNFTLNTKFKELSFGSSLPPMKRKLVEYHYYRGISLFINGDLQNAVVEWKKVLEIDPGNSAALDRIREVQKIIDEGKESIPEKLKQKDVEPKEEKDKPDHDLIGKLDETREF